MSIFSDLTPMVSLTLIVLCLGALWFYSYAIYAAIHYLNQPTSIDPDYHPPVSILKPLCGADSESYTNLASFCQQNYSTYQIIFAAQDATDPCIEIVEKLIYHFPEQDIQLVVSDRSIGANPKVNNLANAAAHAKYSIWLIADSDIRVGKDYLHRIVQPFRAADAGVVTCLYRSITNSTSGVLEALGTATEFHAGVLVSQMLEGMSFALGSTIAIRRVALEQIGGFTAIADYLADDFQIGRLSAQAGYRVILSNYVVEHVITASSLTESIQRQIRWSRGTRVSRCWGYLGMIFTYGTVTSSLLLLATHGSVLGWIALCSTWTARLLMGWAVGVWCLQDSAARRFWWLMPIRDLISVGIWLQGFINNSVEWKGQRLRLDRQGKLIPTRQRSSAPRRLSKQFSTSAK